MPKIPRDLSGIGLAKLVRRYGYEVTRQSGSHLRLTAKVGVREHHITIPNHAPRMGDGTETAPKMRIAKEDTEIWLNLFKLLYYTALSIGIVWHVLYFWLVVHTLPDLDLANLIAYVISVPAVGLISAAIFTWTFVFPGFWLHIAMSGLLENDKHLTVWIEKGRFKRWIVFVSPTIGALILFCLSRWDYVKGEEWLLYLAFLVPNLFWIISFWWGTNWWDCLKDHTKWWQLIIGPGFSALVLSVLSPIVALSLITTYFPDEAARSDWAALCMLLVVMAIAVFSNVFVSHRGFTFAAQGQHNAISNLLGFTMVMIFLLLFLFGGLMTIQSFINPNAKSTPFHKFLSVPFRAMKLGSYDAVLTLDPNYVDSIPFAGRTCLTCHNSFHVLSSIGSEYIIEIAADRLLDKSDYRGISTVLRIPKSKVLPAEVPGPKR